MSLFTLILQDLLTHTLSLLSFIFFFFFFLLVPYFDSWLGSSQANAPKVMISGSMFLTTMKQMIPPP